MIAQPVAVCCSVQFLVIDRDIVVQDDEQEQCDTQNVCKHCQLNVSDHLVAGMMSTGSDESGDDR